MMALEEMGSPSPQPHQPMTKRDVRRNRIVDKLEGIIASFTANQQHHYRAQLQAIQADMTLVLRADPYGSDVVGSGADAGGESGPLEDGADQIREKILAQGAVLPNDEAAQRDYWAMAGSQYRHFAREVNDSIEKRDANMTALHNHYEASVAELQRITQYKMHQAEEEHKHLSSSIRQRLVASITKKRQQLLRDKEQLDIADSNALLLHPNHYSINNPGSPGGLGNRKTRHLRHRAASPSAADYDGSKKRRKLAMMDDDGNESPAPGFRPFPPPDALGGGRSPFKDARDKNTYIQYEAPAYSLERIFTDKELALATDAARGATYRYFFQPQQKGPDEQASATNGTAAPSVDGEPVDPAFADEAGLAETAADTPSLHTAVDMSREPSHQVLTRGGARANPLAALSDLANAAASASAVPGAAADPFAPHIPAYHPVTRSEKSGAPAPPSVNPLDIEGDFALMRQTASHRPDADGDGDEPMDDPATVETASAMRRQLLDQALGSIGTSQPYRLPLLETGPAVIGKGVDRFAATAFAPALSAEQRLKLQLQQQQQKQQAGGPSSMAAALQGRFGGEPMSRTTSAGGASEVGTQPEVSAVVTGSGGRRGRARLV